MNAWSCYWLAWFITAFGTFIVPEVWALVTGNPQNTLSAQIWALEGVVPGHFTPVWLWPAAHFLIGGALAVLLIWLLGHFLFGIWA